MSGALIAPAVGTELTMATRRLMQAEENAAQAGARVLQQWNVVQAILAKPSKQQRVGELENAKEALEFAKAANARAEKACAAAELDKAKAETRADAAASANAVCDSRRAVAISCKRRHADDDDDEHEMGARENVEEEHQPAEKRSKSASSSASSSSSSSSSEAAVSQNAPPIEVPRAATHASSAHAAPAPTDSHLYAHC